MCINKTYWIVRLAVGLAVVLAGAGLSHGVLIDDFNDRSDDGWRHVVSTGVGTSGTWDTSSQKYTLANIGSTEGTVGSAWEASFDDPQFNNGFLKGKLRVNTNNDTFASLLMRAYEVGDWWGGYSFGPYKPEADMNEDQVVNGLDVAPFIAAVVGGTQQIPEPFTLLLTLIALAVVGGWRQWAA